MSLEQLFAKALANRAFLQKLVAEPRAVLAEHGVAVPPGVAIRIVPGEEDDTHLCPTCQLSFPAIDLVIGRCACRVAEPTAKTKPKRSSRK